MNLFLYKIQRWTRRVCNGNSTFYFFIFQGVTAHQITDFGHFDFDPSSGENGDTLAFHPLKPKSLFVVSNSVSKIGKFWLMPLCFQNKPSTGKTKSTYNMP